MIRPRPVFVPALVFILPLLFLTPLWLPEPYRLYLLTHAHPYPHYTWVNYSLVALRSGELPLWFPHIGAGYPNAGSIYNELLNPFYLMMLPTVSNGKLPYLAYEFAAALQWALSGLTFYILMRHLKTSRVGSALGALAYVFNFYSLGQFLLWSATAKVMVWMPLVFLCLVRHFETTGLRAYLFLFVGGALFGLTYTHPYTSILTLTFSLGFVCVGSLVSLSARWPTRIFLAIVRPALFAIASFCSVAPTFFPFIESMLFNPRIQVSPPYWESFTTSGFMEAMLSLLLPDFVLTYRWSYMAPGFLLLAVIGACASGWVRRFILGASIVAFVAALAQWSAVYYVLFNIFPMWHAIREQATSTHISAFCIPMLVSWGADAAISSIRRLRRRQFSWPAWTAFGLIVLALGSLANDLLVRAIGRPPQNPLMTMRTLGLLGAAGILVVLVLICKKAVSLRVAIVMAVAIMLVNQLLPLWFVREFRPSRPTPAYLALIEDLRSPPPDRILEHRVRSNDIQPWLAFPARRGTVNDFGSQSLYRFWKLTARAGITNGTPPFYLPMMGIRSGSSRRLLDLLDVEDADAPIGRFVLVRWARVVPDPDRILDQLSDPEANLQDLVFIEDPVDPSLHDPNRYHITVSASTTRVTVLHYGMTSIELDVENAEGRRFLLFTDNWYPGWKASIGDRSVPVLRGDYSFKAIPIPPGRFSIRLNYQPESFRLGVLAMTVIWLGIGLGWAVIKLSARHRS